MGVSSCSWWAIALSFVGLAAAIPLQDATTPPAVAKRVTSELPRLVIYFQTTHDADGNPVSMLPLVEEQGIALTHLIVCSFHISDTDPIHLNDYPPDDPRFYTLWNETAIMKASGVRVMGMVGGAAAGSFSSDTLDSEDDAVFEKHYGVLHDTIARYGLQGMDLDVEQYMSQAGIERLVARLYADFGGADSGFEITLAPVASALRGGMNLSGFSYAQLADDVSNAIAFYNTQFYSGFGSMASPTDYEGIVDSGGWDPTVVVAGQLTTAFDGSGYTAVSSLNETVRTLVAEYGTIGGIMGWEYFNSAPGATDAPWEWAQEMTEILRPDEVFDLVVTEEAARKLDAAWDESVVPAAQAASSNDGGSSSAAGVKVDYFAMVNA